MLQEIIDRAVQIWRHEEFDQDSEVFDARGAWTQAVQKAITSDEVAHGLAGEIINDPDLKDKVKWGDEFSWENTYKDFIRNSLWENCDVFVEMVKEKIPGYDELLAERKERAEKYQAAEL